MLVVTEDDLYGDIKRELCAQVGATYHILAKTPPKFKPVSSSGIVKWVKAPTEAPLRVDFAGGWLDVPKYAIEGGYVVNCAIFPLVSLKNWDYQQRSGLGGSGAWSLLNGESGVDDELNLGVGWQDPAVISETGLCVWKSGERPSLDFKKNVNFLKGKMAIYWTGIKHDTPSNVGLERNYNLIKKASIIARHAVLEEDLTLLAEAILTSYQVQRGEGMTELPDIPNALGKKYCGGGHGCYALYIFATKEHRDKQVSEMENVSAIEPFLR